MANDPRRVMDKTAANERIKQFATWLDSFKREEYKTIDTEALGSLKGILNDVVRITDALLSEPSHVDVAQSPTPAIRIPLPSSRQG